MALFEALLKYYRVDNKGRSHLCFIQSVGATEVDEREGEENNEIMM